ncbi:DUF1289 domain-containing protein [Pseudomonas rhizosphaerae]|jgi:predicted Fe-S protein YdhL (DUF1289 family)|uniref:Fe-S protein n=1 Tax=Pseudomonas rhizosphaerae TaxID=216142 RepID=A0A089YYW6_9PSED|nr:DUF1289 domain-containing protein [Pseudomonas rhizosphaerae]AIS19667.1 Fe-S protein [Pseudomonas rhizosphaerae]MBD8616248.1 DUF1289 domain-containing protein [Pseudomonas putida]MEB2871660.1 DUF1289 domain-containing protein [Pseudomonas rhizosphaerae]
MNPLLKPVKSPCISVCALDDQDVCTGCQRTAVEITQWGRMSDDERRAVLRLTHQRALAQGLVFPGS